MISLFSRIFASLLLALSFTLSSFAGVETKELQYRAIETQIEEWRAKYGMLKYKADELGVLLAELEAKYKSLVDEAMTLEELYGFDERVSREILNEEQFEQILIGMTAEWRDGHTNTARKSHNGAVLGINAAYFGGELGGGQLVVTGVNKDFYVSREEMKAVQKGDVVIAIDGVSVNEYAKRHAIYAQLATFDTVMIGAHETLLTRSYRKLPSVGDGTKVSVTFLRPGKEDETFTNDYRWTETEDAVFQRMVFGDDAFKEKPSEAEKKLAPYTYGNWNTVRTYFRHGVESLIASGKFEGQLIDVAGLVNAQLTEKLKQKSLAKAEAIVEAGGETLDSETETAAADASKKPLTPVSRLDAYVVNYKGKNIGVLRIPSFSPAGGMAAFVNEIKFMAEVLKFMNPMVDSLIIDTTSNGGGSVYLALKFASFFVGKDKAMQSGTMDMRLSKTLTALYNFPEYLIGGDPESKNPDPNIAEARIVRRVAQRLEERRLAGEKWTGLMDYMGNFAGFETEGKAGQIFPHEEVRFEKPVMVLTDNRNGSGGDFFPSFIQSNELGISFGEQTMGLGGPVHFAQGSFGNAELEGRQTSAFYLKANGKALENVGNTPNIHRSLSRVDLMDDFKGYSTDALDVAFMLASGKSYADTIAATRAEYAKKKDSKKAIKGDKALKGLVDKIAELAAPVKEILESTDTTVLEANASALTAFYREVFKAIAKVDLRTEQWSLVDVPLPVAMVQDDAIFETLWKSGAVKMRLEQTQKIPAWSSYPKTRRLMKSMVTGLAKVETKPFIFGGIKQAEFGKACNIVLK